MKVRGILYDAFFKATKTGYANDLTGLNMAYNVVVSLFKKSLGR